MRGLGGAVILAQAFQRFVFDLDGVVWRGNDPIAGAPETVRAIRDAGKRVCFVTNNSSETHETYLKKLGDVGAGSSIEEIVSSADATARLLERTIPGIRGRLAYVIGGQGLRDAVVGTGARLASEVEATDASLVVVGWDRDLTYEKLRLATLAIRAGGIFVASNTDATYPTPEGMWPGGGAIVAALRTATGIEPVVAGKPEPILLEVAADRLGGTPALVIGDRVETDVAAAHAVGWPSALVLTGASGVPELAASPHQPDYILGSLGELLEDRPHPFTRPGSGPDLPEIATMLHAGGLMSGAARERLGRTLVAEVDRRPIGTAAWEPLEGSRALLRSVAVHADRRTAGVGTVVVAAALRHAYEHGVRDVWLATETAEAFFAARGFRRVDRDQAPESVLEHPQVQRECSVTAAIMHAVLPG